MKLLSMTKRNKIMLVGVGGSGEEIEDNLLSAHHRLHLLYIFIYTNTNTEPYSSLHLDALSKCSNWQ